MAHCEDFPCCGHEHGCCPDFGPDGQQLNMKCVCGAVLPINNPVSICDGCLHDDDLDREENHRYRNRNRNRYDDDEFDDEMGLGPIHDIYLDPEETDDFWPDEVDPEF